MSTSIVDTASKVVKDTWATLVLDVERAIERVTRIASPTLLDLRTVIKSDVLPLLKATSTNMVALRDEMYLALNEHADHLNDIEERLEMLDDVAKDTQLLPEDAELIMNLAGGVKIICEELLPTSFGAGKTKIEEMIAMATAAEQMARDKRIEPEEDDEEDEEGEEAEDETASVDDAEAAAPSGDAS